ncbi:MAG: ATP-dependent zinc metalloprotease FtsH [Candidatus Eisenbacteria bacterium]|uniref:ATP-dependent zinc metalloprotease FtsH n=1 Tax=Eiseniibacteriota bacterium TaxID=2212470 RepID=A0A956SG41_UNCEI|nr:ATP-dependent zinc metalloprotease FtsH [Candidatus Eisenbacteria bacterium]MCB9465181.1 ATP-dependent metallopeptidase FtsH/Yme1/Tma family protein [Candidatus Eisenbacteria bacterium]
MGQFPGRQFRAFTFWLLLVLVVIFVLSYVSQGRTNDREVSYSEFWNQLDAKNVSELTIGREDIRGEFLKEVQLDSHPGKTAIKQFRVLLPGELPDLADKIRAEYPDVVVSGRQENTPWFNIFFSWWIPLLAIFLLWIFFIRQMQAGGSAALKFGKSKAKILNENSVKVTFRDVAGADEAKEELQEIIEFLRDPKKFQMLGGRIPKGALLLGPPGTGKTLLAKAVAGEAGVPFFSMSGSDFVEMFVGVGASRVRDLFEQGKKNAPCIIFIDEIDAVGRHRGAGLGGGHDEREQTLNQLLVEMDGFESNEGVILIAATNRPDVLDPALLRPGRFDRQIVVDRPDQRGRLGILKVHTRGKPLGDDVDLSVLAKGTPGLAGAELANLVNEAALLAARKNKKKINMRDFEEAKDKVMMGAERKSMLLSEEEKKTTAYHEAGHALVAWMLPHADPVHKVTIIPRGRALGVTHYLPEEDHHTRSRSYMLDTMAHAMGGRAAEQIIFGHLTTGASSDIQKVTEIARKMVTEWGMSDKLGPLNYSNQNDAIFLGREIQQHKDYSERTAELIDTEISRLVNDAYDRAVTILNEHLDKLHALALALLDRELLDRKEIGAVIDGEPLDPIPPDGGPTETPPPSPVETPEPRPPILRPDPLPGPSGA